mmetsp:Transcript_1030/g.2099  ORF Transcript_1030/g.2099 Transcript_1030/m.2099 type:complete len:298 (-) Transcript_1030:57-950(-)
MQGIGRQQGGSLSMPQLCLRYGRGAALVYAVAALPLMDAATVTSTHEGIGPRGSSAALLRKEAYPHVQPAELIAMEVGPAGPRLAAPSPAWPKLQEEQATEEDFSTVEAGPRGPPGPPGVNVTSITMANVTAMMGDAGREGGVGAPGNPGVNGTRGPRGDVGPKGNTTDFTEQDRASWKDLMSRLSLATYRAHWMQRMGSKALTRRLAALKKHFQGLKEQLYVDEQQDKVTERKIVGMVSSFKKAEAQANETRVVFEKANTTDQILVNETAALKEQVLQTAEAAQAALPTVNPETLP